ncbi:acetyltransferase (GNAT) family protein [Halanaerobium sp. DL-01]|uniref:GNAT family N-acetyltransferase n=1 Tax=Halanaerobium sp. DL-01 TaxID=1653064 RepID=UPI000DF2960B|nr:GNAT family N-acetyltransferase [Halanaerobium sp. DL-01]RCW79280.1 acetyltransferase (GNAT) family protein [Halanaerobium sp. DL-01]
MNIEYLADRENDISKVVDWLYEQWGHNYEYGIDVWEKRVNNRLNKEKIPTTFIAIVDDEAVGTASIVENDMNTRKDLSPWLADVFVLESYRNRKIATKLIERILKEAKIIGIEKLYLYTREAEGFYVKKNWKIIDIVDYYGDKVTLMEYELN